MLPAARWLLHVGCRTLSAHICIGTGLGTGLHPASSALQLGSPWPHLLREWASCCHIAPELLSFLLEQLRWPLPHLLHWDWLSVATFADRTANEHCPPLLPRTPCHICEEARRARSCHVCAGTDDLTCHITSTTRLGSLSRRTGVGPSSPTRLAPPTETEDGAYPCHICTGTWLTPCHGTGLCPATFAPG
jgi:hypothetical protein